MTRTELLALADRLKLMSRAIQETADSEPEARFCLDLQDSADLMIQIAEAKPAGWTYRFPTSKRLYFDTLGPTAYTRPELVWTALYTLPLED